MSNGSTVARRSSAVRRIPERPLAGNERSQQRQLRVVKDGERKPHTFATYFWIGVVALALALVVMVVTQVLLTQATFRTAEARSELAGARAENERLRLEVAEAESPTLLEERARRQLEMASEEKAESLPLGPAGPSNAPVPPAPPGTQSLLASPEGSPSSAVNERQSPSSISR